MKIGVIGAGSLGLLFAAYLQRVFSVTLYTRTDEQAKEIIENGLLLQKEDSQTRIEVTVLPISKWTGQEEISIITIKQYQLHSIIDKINRFPKIPQNLLFVQNGMGHLKELEMLHAENIYVGSVEHGALKVNSFTVRHNGEGIINAAVFKGDPQKLIELVSAAPADFPLTLKDNYYEILLNKLVVNAVINPLTSILHVRNGELIENPFYFTLFTQLFHEISFVLNLDDSERSFKNIVDICKNTANNRSSMLKDIELKRKTEIDAILGFIIDEAKKQNKNTPTVECYYYLIKGKEMEWGS